MLKLAKKYGRFLVLGDLHLDFWLASGRLPFRKSDFGDLDALIIAGDLTNKPKVRWRKAIAVLADLIDRNKIVIVPGNHDYYDFQLDRDDKLKRLAEAEGTLFAQKCNIEIGDLCLLLCTLWTDFEQDGNYWKNVATAAQQMNDYRYIRLAASKYRKIRPEDTRRVHDAHRAWLETQLEASRQQRTAVVTHHSPLLEAARGDEKLGFCYASDLRDLILRFQPEFWCFGHTHTGFQEQVGRTLVTNVSLGYPDEAGLTISLLNRAVIEF
ncbi:metallophosphoesterase [Roseibium sp. HPY-6]|uniref:metallophosphoesterase family protein n=1 Tax=Roseibium sp. HPY-6 TaxID=3229852 RepID=UPI00338F8BF6